MSDVEAAPASSRAPVERVRRAARRWYRPIGEPASWHAALYLGAGVATTSAAFVVIALIVVGIALVSWTVVGLALVIPGFWVAGAWSNVERRRAGLIGVTIEPRSVARGDWIVADVRARLGDAAR